MTLYVGSDKTPFIVHEDRLCKESSFFRAAFISEFKEGSEQTMDLPDDNVDTVFSLVHWLYKERTESHNTQTLSTTEDYYVHL